MSTCEMLRVIRDARQEQAEARQDRTDLVVQDLHALLGLPALSARAASSPDSTSPAYCGWLESLQGLFLPKTAQAQANAQGIPKLGVPPTGRVRLSNWSEVATAVDRVREADRRGDRYAVEVHKKWAISLACVSFVIIGIVMALRFPRAGIGLVIGGGLAVFSIHYVGLTAGESLADRGLVQPWVAMWTPNIVLTAIGLLGLLRVSRESGTTRGGDFQEILDGVRLLFRLRRRESPE